MTPINFKFQWLNDNGQPKGFLSKKGVLDDSLLKLDDTDIPVVVILEAEVRNNYLILSVLGEDEQPMSFAIQTSSAQQLKDELGRLRSAAWAEAHREDLEQKGLGHTFHQANCPECSSVVNLTGKQSTPQISCGFCDTLSTVNPPNHPEVEVAVGSDRGYRLCDECGMYSKPRRFTIFYFYFLLVVYGWRSSQTWRCPGCMRGEAWKMLAGNSIFVLGVPVALVQLFRSYGGTDVGGPFPGLDNANLKARKGDLEGAIAAYREILKHRPVSAGVKYNIGLALLEQNRTNDAAKIFESALNDCANYRPAAMALAHCYNNLGETDKLKALEQVWGADEQDDAESPQSPETEGADIVES